MKPGLDVRGRVRVFRRYLADLYMLLSDTGQRRNTSKSTRLLPLFALVLWVAVLSFTDRQRGLDSLSWAPWEQRLYVIQGRCLFFVRGIDQELSVAAWIMAAIAAFTIAVVSRPIGLRVASGLAAAAYAVAAAAGAIYGSLWAENALLQASSPASDCPPRTFDATTANAVFKAQFEGAEVAAIVAASVAILIEIRVTSLHSVGSTRRRWRPAWWRLVVSCACWLWTLAVAIKLPISTVNQLNETIHGTSTLPFSNLISMLTLLTLASLMPWPMLSRLGITAGGLLLATAFAQWTFVQQLIHDKQSYLIGNDAGVSNDVASPLTGLQTEVLLLTSQYYLNVMMFALMTCALGMGVLQLLRASGGSPERVGSTASQEI